MARILIADPNGRAAAFLRRALLAEGFVADVVATTERAMDACRSGRYDVVIVSPGKQDGSLLLERVHAERPGIPAVIVSRDHRGERWLPSNSVSYLSEPVLLADVVARIRHHLRSESPVLQAGHLQLDVPDRLVWWRGRPIGLAEREVRLLRHLMEEPGRVCPRGELLEAVWGDGTRPRSNVVDAYVRRLRRKLDPRLIETVPGAGYRLASGSPATLVGDGPLTEEDRIR